MIAWRHRAQYLVNFCRKGDYIEAVGAVRTVPYVDDAGKKREYRYIEAKELRRISHHAGRTLSDAPTAEPEPEAVFHFTDEIEELEESL